MKTIGILGGLGPESTIAYYGHITRKYHEIHGDYAYPEIIIYSLSFASYIGAGYERAGDIADAIRRLAGAGADFVVAACNSVHIVYEQVAPKMPVPWISIMDSTAERIREAEHTKVGLLGTIFTMSKGFYQHALARHGLETLTPPEEEQREINRIIYDELVTGLVKEESREYVLRCIGDLQERGVEGVILGCTELPFLIRQEHIALPLFDTTAIHAQKALDLAME